MKSRAIGIDIGGTKIAVASVDSTGLIHSQTTLPLALNSIISINPTKSLQLFLQWGHGVVLIALEKTDPSRKAPFMGSAAPNIRVRRSGLPFR